MSTKTINEETLQETESRPEKPTKAAPRNYDIVYINILGYMYYHLAGLYGLYLAINSAKWETLLFSYVMFICTVTGITAGVHRLWAHNSYKVKLPLKIFLMLCQSLSNQHAITHWVRDHRLHHKYSDTDADPHNASRGFFYSHVGWLLVKKHPEVKKRGKTIDMTDIYSDPVIRFQERHKSWLITTVAFILPTLIPMYFWKETFTNSWHLNLLRFIITLNLTFLINSASHMWGYKPYDKTIAPSQSMPVSVITMGEGFHNYHHVFPCDYRSGELGKNWVNFAAGFIDFCAYFGLAYDMKTTSEDVIRARAGRTGDGRNLWGFKE